MPVQINPFLTYETGYPNKHLVMDGEAFQRMLKFLERSPAIAFDFETSGLRWYAHACACGIALAGWDHNCDIHSFYVPYRHQTGEHQLELSQIAPAIKALLGGESKLKLAHNIKFDEHIARRDGWEIRGPRYDTMIAARLYNENYRMGLKYRAKVDLGRTDAEHWDAKVELEVTRLAQARRLRITEYKQRYGYAQVNIPLCGTYACFDVEFTTQLYWLYEGAGVSTNYSRIWQTEMDLTGVLCDMEETGLPISKDYLGGLRENVLCELDVLQSKIKALGVNIRLGSDDELRHLLTKTFGLELTRLTKKYKIAVDKEALSEVAGAHPVIPLIMHWRLADKIASTYTTSILDRLDAYDVLHPSFQQLGTNCMPAGQLVLTNRGYIPVETVVPGMEVISHTGRTRVVEAISTHEPATIVSVQLDNGLGLSTSAAHAYYCVAGSWLRADELVVGDMVQTHSDKELWREVKDWSDFRVSSWGRVLNYKTRNILKLQSKNSWGHLKVTLRRTGSQHRGVDPKDFAVHRLVAIAFLGDCPGMEVRHLNGIGWDNTVTNLQWGTSKENSNDAVAQGTMSRRNGTQNKLTSELAEFIRGVPRSELSDYELAVKLGVSRTLIRKVRVGERWVEKQTVGKRAIFGQAVVTAVEKHSPQVVYGMTVTGDHSHVTGGIVTHNTGRLSCREPNFQNQPSDDNDRALSHSGKSLEDGGIDPWSIRRAYENRGPGWVRLYFDYSQIELRVLAYYTKDPIMVNAYLNGEDIHARTSIELFGSKEKIHRKPSKAVNFGLSYCLSEIGLARQLKMSQGEAGKILDKFFERYHGVKSFRGKFWGEVRSNGCEFQNIFGRPRRIPKLNEQSPFERGRAERQAIATLVQGTAAELTKESLVRADKFLKEKDLPAHIVSTVHDEIQLDCRVEALTEVSVAMKKLMEDFPEFSPIPIVVDGEYSTASWADKIPLPK